jgi:quercetin dioxygenase-like cupin family protein
MAAGAGALTSVGSYHPWGGDMAEIGVWEDAEAGVRRRILQAQGRLMLMEVRFAAGAAGYEHSHVHEQISYCVAGRFEYSLDGRTRLLSEGEAVYVPSNTRHGAKALEQGTLIDVFTPVREDLLGPR